MYHTNKLEKIQDYYLDMEREFSEFVQIVPYIGNPWNIHSPRLYGILHHACTQVESLSKLICDVLGLNLSSDSFYTYYKKINEDGLLSSFKIVLERTGDLVQPFKYKNALSLDGKHMQHPWWVAYNRSKHGYPEGMIHSTLGHVINSIGAAYILHEVARTASEKHTTTILEESEWKEKLPTTAFNDRVLLSAARYAYELDSKFFVYITDYKNR